MTTVTAGLKTEAVKRALNQRLYGAFDIRHKTKLRRLDWGYMKWRKTLLSRLHRAYGRWLILKSCKFLLGH